ncbi:3302_t:CDS:1, partial [Ambispora leptoticha]
TEKWADTIFMRQKTYDYVICACHNNKDTDFATAAARHHWR